MASLNKVILIGHLGADPEVRSLPDGKYGTGGEGQNLLAWFRPLDEEGVQRSPPISLSKTMISEPFDRVPATANQAFNVTFQPVTPTILKTDRW